MYILTRMNCVVNIWNAYPDYLLNVKKVHPSIVYTGLIRRSGRVGAGASPCGHVKKVTLDILNSYNSKCSGTK